MPALNLSVITKQFGHTIPETRISQAVRGVKQFGYDDSVFLAGLLTKIENLIRAAHPLPLDLRTNPVVLSELIRDMEAIPPDQPNLANLVLTNEILSGRNLNDVAESRGVSVPELKTVLSETALKLQRASWRLTEIVKEKNNE